jgi:ectoine hydroxylase-related dioxygenase (phytanoyl-CoA dioxygenase family)
MYLGGGELNRGESTMTGVPLQADFRPPVRIEPPLSRWSELDASAKAAWFSEADRELEQVGLAIVAGALSPEVCDDLTGRMEHELRTSHRIERMMHERRRSVLKLYNLQSRDAAFMELIAFPFTVEYLRRFLGQDMLLHTSEGAIRAPVPAGLVDDALPIDGLHYDAFDRIPGYFLAMNSIYYLCDADRSRGATQYVPGSHREFLSREEAAKRETRYIDVKKGDLVIFGPYLWHAGSPNHSTANRPVIINYYVRSYVRQGFDYPRQMSVAEAKRLTAEQRALLGFNHRIMRDTDELYKYGPASVPDMDPVFPLKEN